MQDTRDAPGPKEDSGLFTDPDNPEVEGIPKRDRAVTGHTDEVVAESPASHDPDDSAPEADDDTDTVMEPVEPVDQPAIPVPESATSKEDSGTISVIPVVTHRI